MDNKRIVWLASYPKSGNTWFRVFLTALLDPQGRDIDLNNLYPSPIAASRQLFDDMTGVSSADLSADEIDNLRPAVYRRIAQQSDELIYYKVHDAFTHLPGGQALFPVDLTRAALYFIRNPLDIAVSFASHLRCSIDDTIAIMENPENAFYEQRETLYKQLRQRLLNWSGHAMSWTQQSGMPVMVLRYEDMRDKTQQTFSSAAAFIGLSHATDRINQALEKSSFERLKKQEQEKGFLERAAQSESFFRKGLAGSWRNVLTPEQVDRIVRTHREVMERFGYIP